MVLIHIQLITCSCYQAHRSKKMLTWLILDLGWLVMGNAPPLWFISCQDGSWRYFTDILVICTRKHGTPYDQ